MVVAPYWHPIDVPEKLPLLDLYSGGRLEFGIGSGAYQREFDRMRPGLKQSEGYKYTQEMLPAVKALWAGDYAIKESSGHFPLPRRCLSRCNSLIPPYGSQPAHR
ncbi:MAG: hypothetical protein CM1200mP18_07330 [Gammaproteobacteria bacterium]|nr:MAG: hypothetical protein CM1200mP18_07330 [Gammaproteobacteria bacterium]